MTQKIIIYYDPDCGFCKRWCYYIVSFLLLKNVEILEIYSNKEALAIFKKEYSWAVYSSKKQKFYSKSKAFWVLVRASPFFILYCISYLPFVGWVGDRIYDFVARSRPKTCIV